MSHPNKQETAGKAPPRTQVTGCCSGRGNDHSGHADLGGAPAAGLAKDPVCGMTVDPHKARHTATHAGRPYYFCSAGCRTKFLAAPERYAGAGAQGR